ncbi:MAG: cell division protein FtsQ/DivIB [Acidimicrobiales bacterium]
MGGFVAVGYSPFLNIEKIEVHGLHHLTLAEIEERLGFEPGDPLLSLDQSAVRRRIEALPRVQSVSVDRSWSGVVLIEIIEHQPAALVMSEPEQWALIASPPDLPRISGIRAAGAPGSYLSPDSSSLLSLLRTMPPGLLERFVSLRREPATGDLSGSLDSAQEVIFGDEEQIPAKVVALSALLSYLEEQMRTDRVLDVSVPERPVVSPS